MNGRTAAALPAGLVPAGFYPASNKLICRTQDTELSRRLGGRKYVRCSSPRIVEYEITLPSESAYFQAAVDALR